MRVDSSGKLMLGLATGTAFGWLLNKGRVARPDAITNQLLFRDPSVFKAMGIAVAVGSLGVQALVRYGDAQLQVRPLNAGVVLGALLFGPGMALLGFCPGTTAAAIGAGSRDARAGLLGMLAGAVGFVAVYPHLKPIMESLDQGKLTLPKLTKTSPWGWVAGLCAVLSVGAAAELVRRRL